MFIVSAGLVRPDQAVRMDYEHEKFELQKGE